MSLKIRGHKGIAKVALAALDTAGGVLAWKNPMNETIHIDRLKINTTVVATGAGTADFGVAANGTTSNDSLIDGLDVNAALILTDNVKSGGANGKSIQALAAGSYVTGSKASGNMAGLVGYAIIEFTIPSRLA